MGLREYGNGFVQQEVCTANILSVQVNWQQSLFIQCWNTVEVIDVQRPKVEMQSPVQLEQQQ